MYTICGIILMELLTIMKVSLSEEFTIMKVIIEGFENGDKKRITYYMKDEYDKRTGLSSMSRTTAFVTAATARLAANGEIDGYGVIYPEKLGENEKTFDFIMNYLRERNVVYERTEELI